MKENQDYKNEALAALKGNWSKAVLATLVVFLILGAFESPYLAKVMTMSTVTDVSSLSGIWGGYSIFLLGYILVGMPLMVGFVNAFKVLLTHRDNRLTGNSFRIGFGNYLHHLWGSLLRSIFIMLWSLLLYIPGIIKTFSYAMTSYILVDYPQLSANKAIDLSREMMRGRKFDLFYLYLSFIGWFLLCILTLGIGFFWFIPYVQSAQASFYQDVKADYLRSRGIGGNPVETPVAPQEAPAPAEPIETPAQPGPRAENPEDYMPK